MADNAIARWFRTGNGDGESVKRVAGRHPGMVELNAVVSEYGTLIEGVSAERADLLYELSKLRLENAELAGYKALFDDLEAEIRELRGKVQEAAESVTAARLLRQQLTTARDEAAQLRRELGVVRGQLTKAKARQS